MICTIVGLGVSGLAYLYSKLKYTKDEVVIINEDENFGKRILVSGNGRCNISNVNLFSKDSGIHYRSGNKFLSTVFDDKDKNLLEEFIKDIDIDTIKDDEGRIYPFSHNSSTVDGAIKRFVFNPKYANRIKIVIDRINSIDIKTNTLYGEKDKYNYGKLFIATGGFSYDRKENTFLNDLPGFSHFVPALGPITPSFTWPKRLEGTRVRGTISFDNGFLYEESGELLFKEKNLSGILVFNASLLADNREITFDFTRYKNNKVQNVNNYQAYLPLKLYQCYKELPIENGKMKFKIKSLPKFKDSQVSRGGISLEYLEKNTYKYLINNNISFGGECIDVCGICGGYNISFAIISGIKAALNN